MSWKLQVWTSFVFKVQKQGLVSPSVSSYRAPSGKSHPLKPSLNMYWAPTVCDALLSDATEVTVWIDFCIYVL